MLRNFHIDNFKSLVDFWLPPAPYQMGGFACLVGLNGAGKSTVLQALDFVGHVASGQVSEWLDQREWSDSELKSRFTDRLQVLFATVFDLPPGRILWTASYRPSARRCAFETVRLDGQELLRTRNDRYVVAQDGGGELELPRHALDFEGSLLSVLKDDGKLHDGLRALKTALAGLRSLDMLNPREMRRRSRDALDIGYGGERLSGYIHKLSKPRKEALLQALQSFYPQLTGLTTKAMRAGWRDLRITETFHDGQSRSVETGARQINDGLLRVLAVLSQAAPETSVSKSSTQHPSPGCVLFDEIENGINPELMEKLVGLLLDSPQQVIVTTHSPLILNYLPEDVAKEAVVLLYRNPAGHTKAVRLFDLPSASRKLGLLGPGEVYVDTSIADLVKEAQQLAADAEQQERRTEDGQTSGGRTR